MKKKARKVVKKKKKVDRTPTHRLTVLTVMPKVDVRKDGLGMPIMRVRIELGNRRAGYGSFVAENYLCTAGLYDARILPGKRYKLVPIR